MKIFVTLLLLSVCSVASTLTGQEEFEFSLDSLKAHQKSYKDLAEAAGPISLEDPYIAGRSIRSADSMANGISYLIRFERLLSESAAKLDPDTLLVLRGLLAQRYFETMDFIQLRHAASKDMQKATNSDLTLKFLKQEQAADERCYKFMQLRLRDLAGEDGADIQKLVSNRINALLEEKTKDSIEAAESYKVMMEFGQKTAQKGVEFMKSGELGAVPSVVGYVGEDYLSINRNSKYLACAETIFLVLSKGTPEAVSLEVRKSLLLAHFRYLFEIDNRIAALKKLKMLHPKQTHPGVAKRLNDLLDDLKTAKGFSKKRMKELLENEDFRDQLDSKLKELLKENGLASNQPNKK